jgi:5-methylcytosine-specific restriction protein A
MPERKREFRSPESYEAEQFTRGSVKPFLESLGFTEVLDKRRQHGRETSQVMTATDPRGGHLSMSVRVCWRKENRASGPYVAFQFLARAKNGDFEGAIAAKVQRATDAGATHFLAVQGSESGLAEAALIPLPALLGIWRGQDEMGVQLIRQGRAGRVRQSPARNGRSPTIWLRDRRSPEMHRIPDILWSTYGVIDLMGLPRVGQTWDDTFDDCGAAPLDAGRDEGERHAEVRSGYARDQGVRRLVLQRAGGCCERCGATRDFAGFLDVHHVMGVDRSDRPWTCVALCPNCHRDAHYSPKREEIKAALSKFAENYSLI